MSLQNQANKICCDCHLEKPTTEFYQYITKREKYCKQCKAKYRKQTRQANKIAKKIGLRPGPCQICGSTDRIGADHCHKLNEFRAVLCGKCNVGRAWLGEDVKKIREWCDKAEQVEAANILLMLKHGL